jgi:hypothetical protein
VPGSLVGARFVDARDRSAMSETYQFALLMLLTAAPGLFALLSNRLTERIKVPAPRDR